MSIVLEKLLEDDDFNNFPYMKNKYKNRKFRWIVMCTSSSFQESVSADKTSIGFEYQFYYFIYKVLDLNKDQRLGYEVKDDVHLELPNGECVLMQLKHSMKEKSDGSISNLTTKDNDLWKTIYNWINMIKEIDNGSYNEEILKKYTFILVSNKGISETNTLLSDIQELKAEKISIDKVKENVRYLMNNTNNIEKLFKYMNTFYNLEDDILELFLKRTKFDLEFDNIIEKIRDKIESEGYIDRKRVDDVLKEVIGNFSIWKFETVKSKGQILIDYEEAYLKIKPCYEKVRRDGIPNRNIKINLPEKIMEQEFIKELIDIGEIDETDKFEATKFTKYMLEVEGLLEDMYQDGIITKSEIDRLEKDAICIWENIHKGSYIKIKRKTSILDKVQKKDMLNDGALDCLYKTREEKLKVNQDELSMQLCNGEFYSLSESNNIGWKIEWERKYKQ